MMINTSKKRLALAVAGTLSLGASMAQAEDFTASATLQNTLAVTNLQDLDIGSVFATVTGAALANGVGALVIAPGGTIADQGSDSATVNLTSLTSPTAAQGSVDMTADFTLQLPDTSAIVAADFAADGTSTLVNITNGTGNATELVHESANPAVPSLWLMHFTVGDVSGGVSTAGTLNEGDFTIVPDFGQTTYVFNIGATLTTEPTTSEQTYQEGVYSGTFEVTAAY
ncbi:hypothetical protein ACUNV4_20015 [Granulosicoccus sp. 3-233]|uniref:hypothetical protein n=1 Tax=Granulosicoccus sp. 3-233 TaxID=3417969 RepID=UPI003D3264D9